MSNSTRQNNKRSDRKMNSNDSPEIPDREGTSEELGLPSGQNNVSGSIFKPLNTDELTRRREICQKKRK